MKVLKCSLAEITKQLVKAHKKAFPEFNGLQTSAELIKLVTFFLGLNLLANAW
jgi:hypothetical protein